MPFDALPPHLNPRINSDAWKGTDHDSWLIHWKIKIIGWFAYGPRSNHWWAKWRELPITLFGVFGDGVIRWESSGGEFSIRALNKPIFLFYPSVVYLSRIQKWTKWHVQLQWPLFFACHFTYKDIVYFFYIGAKRDADKIYWFPSIFIGRGWK